MIRDIKIGFTAGTDLVCYLIRRNDTAWIDGKRVESRINHVLTRFIWDDGPDLIFQSHAGEGVGICPTSDIKRAIGSGKVFRYAEKSLKLSAIDKSIIWQRAQALQGNGYDYRIILMYYLAEKTGVSKFCLWHNKNRFTCNEAFVHVFTGALPWVNPDLIQKPEALFTAAFECPSPVYFDNHADIEIE